MTFGLAEKQNQSLADTNMEFLIKDLNDIFSDTFAPRETLPEAISNHFPVVRQYLELERTDHNTLIVRPKPEQGHWLLLEKTDIGLKIDARGAKSENREGLADFLSRRLGESQEGTHEINWYRDIDMTILDITDILIVWSKRIQRGQIERKPGGASPKVSG